MCSREAGLTFRLARFTPVTHTRQEGTNDLRQCERDVSDSHLVRGLRCRDGVARVARPPRAGAERACGPPGRPGRRAGAPDAAHSYCLEWRFRMPETARPTHRQWRQEHCANPGTRARRHAPTRPPPRSRRGEEAACLCTDRRHRDADPSGCDVTLPIPYRTSCNHCEVLRRFVRHFRRTHRQ